MLVHGQLPLLLHSRDHSRQHLERENVVDQVMNQVNQVNQVMIGENTFLGEPSTETPFTLCSKEAILAVSKNHQIYGELAF